MEADWLNHDFVRLGRTVRSSRLPAAVADDAPSHRDGCPSSATCSASSSPDALLRISRTARPCRPYRTSAAAAAASRPGEPPRNNGAPDATSHEDLQGSSPATPSRADWPGSALLAAPARRSPPRRSPSAGAPFSSVTMVNEHSQCGRRDGWARPHGNRAIPVNSTLLPRKQAARDSGRASGQMGVSEYG
jgi:hypothetical protein